jgi:hypothetical protein
MMTHITRIFLALFFLLVMMTIKTSVSHAQVNADPVTSSGAGAFTEFGYNARAIAMGGAMVAVTRGEFQHGTYNPGVIGFQDGYRASFSYALLSLDRSLNSIAISLPLPSTRRAPDTTVPTGDLGSRLRLQLGYLRAGVGNIDARDAEGDQIGTLDNSENEFFGGFGVRLSPKLALGFSARFYHAILKYPMDNVTSGGFGLDLGTVWTPIDKLNVGISLQHIAAKYHWDSGKLYGQTGSSTTDYLPFIARLGASYQPIEKLLVATELDFVSRIYDAEDAAEKKMGSKELSLGVEYELAQGFFLRAGVRGLDLQNSLRDEIVTNAGFAYTLRLSDFEPTVSYALMNENAGNGVTQMITVGVRF